MKRIILGAGIVCLFFGLAAPILAQAQTEMELGSAPCFRAEKGDTMWVILNQIKADKCTQFEKLMHEICWPVFEASELPFQKAADHTRFLNPAQMNEDSTFTYIIIMDPVIRGVDYRFGSVLKMKYNESETDQYLKQIGECFASPQIMFPVIQSRH
jgi:hypothetical protein